MQGVACAGWCASTGATCGPQDGSGLEQRLHVAAQLSADGAGDGSQHRAIWSPIRSGATWVREHPNGGNSTIPRKESPRPTCAAPRGGGTANLQGHWCPPLASPRYPSSRRKPRPAPSSHRICSTSTTPTAAIPRAAVAVAVVLRHRRVGARQPQRRHVDDAAGAGTGDVSRRVRLRGGLHGACDDDRRAGGVRPAPPCYRSDRLASRGRPQAPGKGALAGDRRASGGGACQGSQHLPTHVPSPALRVTAITPPATSAVPATPTSDSRSWNSRAPSR